jgi:hypothetical protein
MRGREGETRVNSARLHRPAECTRVRVRVRVRVRISCAGEGEGEGEGAGEGEDFVCG